LAEARKGHNRPYLRTSDTKHLLELGWKTLRRNSSHNNVPKITERVMLRISQASQKASSAGSVDRMRNTPTILCQCPTLAGHRLEIFSSAWLELTYVRGASITLVLGPAVQSGLFERP
jgi:hypothetical protein